jgi:hypothetical protein
MTNRPILPGGIDALKNDQQSAFTLRIETLLKRIELADEGLGFVEGCGFVVEGTLVIRIDVIPLEPAPRLAAGGGQRTGLGLTVYNDAGD